MRPRALAGLSAARALEAFAAGSVVVALPHLVRIGPAGAAAPVSALAAPVGLLLAAFGVALAAAQPVVARRTRAPVAARRWAIGGALVLAAATAAMRAPAPLPALLVLRAMQGVGAAALAPTTASLVASLSPGHRRGRTLGVFASARMAGFALGPVASGLLIDGLGAGPGAVAAVMDLAAGCTLASAAVLAAVSLPGAAGQGGPRPGVATRGPGASGADEWLPDVRGLALGAFAATGAATALYAMQAEVVERLALPTALFGGAAAAMLLVRMASSYAAGRRVDEAGGRPVALAGLGVVALGSLALPVASSAAGLLVLRAGMGLGMAAFQAAAWTSATAGDGRTRAARVAWLTAASSLGMGLGPALSGLLGAASYPAPFVFWGLAGGVALCVLAPTPVGAPVAAPVAVGVAPPSRAGA